MLKMGKILSTLTSSAILLTAAVIFAKETYAAVRCEIQYGGREVCVRTGQLQIDKEVFDPNQNKFVDNLGINDRKFAPGEEITFKLIIKNVGDATFDKVTVTDTLPSLLERISGDLNFEITNLGSGQTQEREFKVKAVSKDRFPNNQTTVCVINTAEAISGNEKDRDTAQVCLERKVVGPAPTEKPKELPPTGPEDWFLFLTLSLLSGTTGVYLLAFRKK